MDSVLTTFQVRCEDALWEALEFHGDRLLERRIVEDGEPFVHGQLDGGNIEIWIYADGAEYRAARKRRNYDVAVFGDEDETIHSFVSNVVRELK